MDATEAVLGPLDSARTPGLHTVNGTQRAFTRGCRALRLFFAGEDNIASPYKEDARLKSCARRPRSRRRTVESRWVCPFLAGRRQAVKPTIADTGFVAMPLDRQQEARSGVGASGAVRES